MDRPRCTYTLFFSKKLIETDKQEKWFDIGKRQVRCIQSESFVDTCFRLVSLDNNIYWSLTRIQLSKIIFSQNENAVDHL